MAASCSIYVHDPGPRFNELAMRAEPNITRWTDPDHSWHVARWLHRGLLRHANRSTDPATADAIFIAHYFLTYNFVSAPLVYGAPVLQWQSALRSGGVSELLRRDPVLLRRWKRRPSDFVAVPLYLACTSASLHHELAAARWIVADPYLGNRCDFHEGHDVIAPLVHSSAAWGASAPQAAPSRPRFLTYIGRLGKPYVDYPMSLLRFMMWSELHDHPNVTFWATDAADAVLPHLRDARCQQPPKLWLKAGVRCCKRCAYGCKRCLEPPLDTHRAFEVGVGTAPRIRDQAAYRAALASSTFCLVLRGDTESTLKFTEAILAGCVPVLIADMPSWPFATRLDYSKFSVEFDWRAAAAEPRRVVQALLRLPAAEVEAMRRELSRVRGHFFYHDETSRAGAVTQLVADICQGTAMRAAPPPSAGSTRAMQALYDRRPMAMRVARISAHRVGRGAQRGSLHHVSLRLIYAEGGTSEGFVKAEPFQGSAALAAYLKTREGQRLSRYVQ